MRPFRFRIRALVILVAAVAIVLGVFVTMQRRSRSFGRRAAYHKVAFATIISEYRTLLSSRNTPEEVVAVLGYHQDMSVKYRSAAARPWLPVGPDPAPPALRNNEPSSAADQ